LRLAAIDLGSNSIKLVVVEAAGGDSFTELASEREVIRLGQETLLNKHIGDAAIVRAVDCLKRFRSVAERHGAQNITAIATAFLREADNADDFVAQVEEETGLRVEMLAGIEEARLVGLAATHGCAPKGVTTLNVDIGGGSTEISIFSEGEPLKLISIKMGAVGFTDRFIRSDLLKNSITCVLRSVFPFELPLATSANNPGITPQQHPVRLSHSAVY
jgi:exopolyphosphatase/guanosine-5'-triphosphate,3'-diphosphate pyrophosphatase